MKKQHDLEENIFGFVDTSHRRYKLRRDVEQTPDDHGLSRGVKYTAQCISLSEKKRLLLLLPGNTKKGESGIVKKVSGSSLKEENQKSVVQIHRFCFVTGINLFC